MKITKTDAPSPKLVYLDEAPNYSVVRHNGKLYYHHTSGWLTFAMEAGGESYIRNNPQVEVVDCELVVKS